MRPFLVCARVCVLPSYGEGMLRMLAEPGRLEQMGRQSRAIAEGRFDVHSVNHAILGAMDLA